MVTAAILMGLATALAVRPTGLRRLHDSDRGWTMPAWARGRPDAWSGRLRFGVATSGSALIGLLVGLPLIAVVVVAVVGGVIVGVLLGRVESSGSKRRGAQLLASLPQACDLLAACLDAGLPLRAATKVVADALGGPLGEELSRVAAQTSLGISDHEAWRSLTHPSLVRLGRDLARASEEGTVSAKNLRLHAADATARAHSVREEAARRVGVKSVLPLMACFLPAFLLLGIVPIVGGFVGTLLG